MTFDQGTLAVTTAAAVGFTGLLLLAVQRPLGTLGPLSMWGVAMVLGSIGIALGAAARVAPRVPDGLSTAVLLGAATCSWTAARMFAERRPLPLLIVVGPAVWLATIPVQDGYSGWIAASCLVGAGYTGATVLELLRTGPEALPSRGPAVGLMLVHTTTYGLRGTMALLSDDPVAGWLASALLLESLLNTVGVAVLLTGMVRERAEQRSTAALLALTLQDGLTGIANRRHFDKQLDEQFRRAARQEPGPALLTVDVDHFKAFNDAVGHHDGDVCLREVAQTIARHVRRPGDLAARYGGEEFAVILADTGLPGALEVAEAVRAAVAALGLHHPTANGVVTVSIGVAGLPDGATARTPVLLVQRADAALYRAKLAGRNTVCCS